MDIELQLLNLLTKSIFELADNPEIDAVSRLKYLYIARDTSKLLHILSNEMLTNIIEFDVLCETFIIFCGRMPWHPDIISEMLNASSIPWFSLANMDDVLYALHEEEYIELKVVVGSENFDKTLLFNLKKLMDEHPANVQIDFFSQEDFLKLLVTGHVKEYIPDDARISNHDGLSYLISLGFIWPSMLKWAKRPTHKTETSSNLSIESCLASMGYSASKNMTTDERRIALRIAIKENKCGFKKVVKHLAWLVSRDSGDQMLDYANDKRKQDLAWLKLEYYKPPYPFEWPSY